MPSARLVLAAQTNGAKSRGPKTTEGKRRSAANSRRHGLYSAKIIPDAEYETEFRELLPTLIDHYRPATPVERRIVESLAQAIAGIHWTWRETRAAFERGLLDHPDPSQPLPSRIFDVFGRQSSLLARIDTLERRFTRNWRTAAKLLENRPEELTGPLAAIAEKQKSAERTGRPALQAPAKSRYTTLGPELPPSGLRIFFGERTEYDSNSKFHYWSDP
jgi:hypothetical protein